MKVPARVAGLITVAVAAVLVAAGCGTSPSPVPSPAPAPVGPRWMANGGILKQWLAADQAGAVKAALDVPGDIITVSAADPMPAGWTATAVQSFTSYDQLAAAIDGGRLLPGVGGVVYDDESWSFTPRPEQQDPEKYIAMAATLAHQHHLLLVATPAMNLATGLGRRPGETLSAAYLRLGIPGLAAKAGADVVEIQAQGVQGNLAQFTALVTTAANQVHQIAPGAAVFAGVSTNPSGAKATAAEIEEAVRSVRGVAVGFWLNDPAKGDYCPRCAGPYPSVAVQTVTDLKS